MKLLKNISYSLSFIVLFTFSANAQSKKSPLAILADELDPKEIVTPELDNYQKLQAQLDAYDEQHEKHLKEQKELEKKAVIERAHPTPNPDLLSCNSLQDDNVKLLKYIKTLEELWKSYDRDIKGKENELARLNRTLKTVQMRDKDLFVQSDLDWIKSANDNVERAKKAYDSDMSRYKDGIAFKIENSECNLKKGCNPENKKIKMFIALCKKWQKDKDGILNKIEKNAKEKYKKMLSTYTNTINQINKLYEKGTMNYPLKREKSKIDIRS